MLTIRQIYIRLADGLTFNELLYAAQMTPARFMKATQARLIPSAPWHIDLALFFALHRDGAAAHYLRDQVSGALIFDATVPANAERLAKTPVPLLVLTAGECQPLDSRRTRKAMARAQVHEATLIDVSRIGLDFFTRLETIIERRAQRFSGRSQTVAASPAKPQE